jgi:8-oxo-dGTP pyrophosphatase MutT (NUDIX family)
MSLSDYVAKIRDKIGTDLLLLPSVAVLPRDDDGRILLVKHSYTGRWGTVGGAIEPDERPEDALRRETREEIGVELGELTLVAVCGGPGYHITYPNDHHAAFVVTVYDARIASGEAVPDDDEVTEIAWFAPDAITGLDLNPLARALMSDLGYASPST